MPSSLSWPEVDHIGPGYVRALQRSDSTKRSPWIIPKREITEFKTHEGRTNAHVLIHRDATPKADALRDAFKSSSSQNKVRLRTKGDLHTEVIIDADGGWRNTETCDVKKAADYEAKVIVELRDPLKELSDDQQGRVEEWGKLLAWRDGWLKKQRNHTMTDQDWVDYERELSQLKTDLS